VSALLAVLVLLRRRLSEDPADRFRNAVNRADKKRGSTNTGGMTPLTTPQMEQAQRELFVPLPDGSRELLVPDSRGTIKRVLIKPTKQSTFSKHRQDFTTIPDLLAGRNKSVKASAPDNLQLANVDAASDPAKQAAARQSPSQSASQAVKKVGVNKEFLRQLRAIFKIIIPRSSSKEVFLFALHTSFLLLRTYLSLLVAKLDGMLVRDLVSANAQGFLRGLVYWWLLAIPSTYTNSMIRYLQQKLSISFRTRLTRYVHDLYLSKARNFYKIINLDTRVEGADQFITTDLARFCDSLAALYSNVSKPTLDLILFNFQLGRSIGKWGSAGLMLNYFATAWILKKVTPAFGKLAAIEAKLEGDFRAAHSRLITNAEEIAFYNGAHLEKGILSRAYLRLVKHVNSIFKIRIAYSMTEDFVIKYAWSAAGYLLISIPVFFGDALPAAVIGENKETKKRQPSAESAKVAVRTENYISNRRLLLALADAGGRLMSSYKDMAQLAGYTSRVYTLLSTLHELDVDHYQSVSRPTELDEKAPFYDLGHINGVVIDGVDGVQFEHVPIVAPAPGLPRGGEELVKSLDVNVQPGDHLLITGANGTGKTSFARILAKLWPTFDGIVRRPNRGDIMFLPQRPYLSLGSLRDQIIYPDSWPDMQARGLADEDLLDILTHVHLSYLPSREGGLDTRKEWKDVLSGGEKQRMGLARLFYHQPKFGVLDECTSAVSTDVEGQMYQHAKDLGITLITISHRPSLTKYHQKLLRLTGEHGGWEISTIGTAEERMSFEKEKEALQNRLKDVDGWKDRLKEIEQELAFKKPEDQQA